VLFFLLTTKKDTPSMLNGAADIGPIESDLYAGVTFPTTSVTFEASAQLQTLYINISKPYPSAVTVSATCSAVNGTALSGIDYVMDPQTVTWEPLDNSLKTCQITFSYVDYWVPEKYFSVVLTGSNATVYGAGLLITIADNNASM
jgi:hypothetical protein